MPSKLSTAGTLIARGIYDDLTTFAELESRISALFEENTKAEGDAFEVFIEGYLATQQKMQADEVWLVGQIPPDIRQELNLPSDTKGIDGVFRSRTGTLVPYQVKFRSNRAYLTYTEVAPFLGLTERAKDRIIFTNSDEIALDAKNRDAMRSVRGIDFDDLTAKEFDAISSWLREVPPKISKPEPRDYQIEALNQIADTFDKHDRATVVMACGTGKTLLALWIAERQKPKNVLVLLPSLSLLQQTLDEWSKHNSWNTKFSYLCVCSDPSVAQKNASDPIELHNVDVDFRVDTDPAEVRRFLEREADDVKIVFSTYQSSKVVSEGTVGLPPFDLGIFDEAHKTTGPQGGLFALSLKDENIAICKRLFLTATPRHYDIRRRDKEGEFKVISMDDEAIYGARAYTLTFGEAASKGIICNYKVVISVVDGHEINDFALQHGITLIEGDLIGAKWVANQIALERAIEETGAKRAITFHSRVNAAKDFASDTTRGITQFLPDFSVFHVNGSQKSSERRSLIKAFREAPQAIITNARCLTEGIDIPAVDMVAFVDPRRSQVDIAQATGRAMRKPYGSDKTIGYVVIPLFLEQDTDETLEASVEKSDFSDVASVLNAMREQDNELVQIIQEIQEEKGEKQVFSPRRLSEKIEIVGPSIDLSTLRSTIFATIVDRIGISWDHWHGLLKCYRHRNGNANVPVRYFEKDYALGRWVNTQRSNIKSLSVEKKRRLDSLGFIWQVHDAQWELGFSRLRKYYERNGDCNVSAKYIDDKFKLGQWVTVQRTNYDSLSEDRRGRLEEIGFDWNPKSAGWNEGIKQLSEFCRREKHCRVKVDHIENGFRLGNWVNRQRSRRKNLTPEQVQSLNSIGFEWNPNDVAWENAYAQLVKYYHEHGNCVVPQIYDVEGFKLGNWVTVQRGNAKTLRGDRKKRLDKLGFQWNLKSSAWDEKFDLLVGFYEREGHCFVPKNHLEAGINLGSWVSEQRVNYKKGNLDEDRVSQLNSLGFEWNIRNAKWDQGLKYLQSFKNLHGHCRVPDGYKENDYPLGAWVRKQRANKKKISEDRYRKLADIGFEWDPLATVWEEGFRYLQFYKKWHGTYRVPSGHKENGYRLGQWVSIQRFQNAKGKLSEDRKQRLDEIGFIWDARKSKS